MSFMIVRGLGVRNAGGANRNESEEVEVRKKNPVWHTAGEPICFSTASKSGQLKPGRQRGVCVCMRAGEWRMMARGDDGGDGACCVCDGGGGLWQ